jgi:hypothetical protein
MRNMVKHNKLRNTGLLFEFLLRQITAEILDNKKSTKLIETIKRRFSERTELGKELALYNILINKKFDSDKKADFFISEVVNERQKLNETQLKREKFNLIKELKLQYDLQKFLSSKIENYKIHASIYKLFEYYNDMVPEDKTETYFNLIENLTTMDADLKIVESTKTNIPQDKDLRIITYKILLERFNDKYSKLNQNQKGLLKAFINNVSNTNSLSEYIDYQIPKLKSELTSYSKCIDDKIIKIKLTEAINSIDKFCKVDLKSNTVKDSVIVQTMRYMELLKQLKINDRKKS